MLSFRKYGDSGSVVILLHGGPGAPGHMAPIGRGLEDSYRLLEPFQRGSGGERLTVARHIADLHEFITTYAADSPPVLLGSSWGAMLALSYAAAHPSSAGQLILVGCGTFDLGARARLQETLGQRMNAEVQERLERAGNIGDENERLKAIVGVLSPVYSYDPLPDSPTQDKVDARAQQETWDDMVRSQAEGIYPAAFASIKTPVLMVHGTFDPHPGALIRAGLQHYMPQMEYRELERCGHFPLLETGAADEFFALVHEWLERHSGFLPKPRKASFQSYDK